MVLCSSWESFSLSCSKTFSVGEGGSYLQDSEVKTKDSVELHGAISFGLQ